MRFYIAHMATLTTQHGITVPLDDGIISRHGNFGSHRLPPWGMAEFSAFYSGYDEWYGIT